MRALSEVIEQFAYHPANAVSAPKHGALRTLYTNHAMDIWPLIPDGPEKTLAMRKLQESLMYANLAVALTVPSESS